jgi:glyoxylase I family protein
MVKGRRLDTLPGKALPFAVRAALPSTCSKAGPIILQAKSIFRAKRGVDMEPIISNLLTRFEKGSLSRRELVRGLAMLAASGTAAAAQEEIDFKNADIDHVSIQVADLQRSVDFYQKMFGFSVISQDQPHGIIRLGNTRTLVSLNHESPAGIVDHFAIGIPRFTKESAASYVKQRGATPLDDPYAGLHIKDPDGINVQIFGQR